MLPLVTNEHEQQSVIALLGTLAQQGVFPYEISTLENINAWLPHAMHTEGFLAYKQRVERFFAKQSHQKMVAKFKQRMQKNTQSITSWQSDIAQCETLEAYTTAKVARNTRWKLHKHNRIDFTQRINQLIKHTSTPVHLISHALASNSTLNADQKSTIEQSLNNELPAQVDLLLALKHYAPWREIKALLDDGATLPNDAIFILAAQANDKMINKLIPYGLTLDAVDAEQKNALHYALTHPNPAVTMRLLLQHNISPMSGPDVVFSWINALSYAKNPLYTANILRDEGVAFTSEHLQYLYYKVPATTPMFVQARDFIRESL